MAKDKRRGLLFSIYTTGFTVCQIAGPSLLSVVDAQHTLVIWLTGLHLLGCLPILCVNGSFYRSHSADSKFGVLSYAKHYPHVVYAVGLFALFDTAMLSLFTLVGVDMGYSEQVALLMISVLFIGDSALQIPIGWLSDHLGRQAMHIWCGLLMSVSCFMIPWAASSEWLLWILLVVMGASAGGVYTLALITIGDNHQGQELVMANASVGIAWSLGALIGPILGGVVIALVGGTSLMFCLAVLAFGFVLLSFRAGTQLQAAS